MAAAAAAADNVYIMIDVYNEKTKQNEKQVVEAVGDWDYQRDAYNDFIANIPKYVPKPNSEVKDYNFGDGIVKKEGVVFKMHYERLHYKPDYDNYDVVRMSRNNSEGSALLSNDKGFLITKADDLNGKPAMPRAAVSLAGKRNSNVYIIIDVKKRQSEELEKQVVVARDYQRDAYNDFIAKIPKYVPKPSYRVMDYYSGDGIVKTEDVVFKMQYAEQDSGEDYDKFNVVNMIRNNSNSTSLMSKDKKFLEARADVLNENPSMATAVSLAGKRKSNRKSNRKSKKRKSKKRKFKKRKSNKRKFN